MTDNTDLEQIVANLGVLSWAASTLYRSLITAGIPRRQASRWTEAWLSSSNTSVTTATIPPVLINGNN